MENIGNNSVEERIEVLEMKCRETDAQARAVLAELREIRVILDRMERKPAPGRGRVVAEEPAIPEADPADKSDDVKSPAPPAPSDKSVVVHQRQTPRQEPPAEKADPTMVRIMQSDGTFRMEPRRGENSMMDSSGAWDVTKKSTSFRGKKKP